MMGQKTYINSSNMGKNYDTARHFYAEIQKLCQPDAYNLFLHKQLSDVFYIIGTKQEFEDIYNTKLHFIVRPQHEFIMKMYGVTDYSVFDTSQYEKEVQEIKFPYISKLTCVSQIYNKTHNWDTLCKDLFQSIPIKGLPFIADCDINVSCHFDKFWSYLGAYNLGLDIDNIRHKLPKHTLTLSPSGTKALKKIAPLDKIVLFAPETSMGAELAPEFWNIIAERVHARGFTIIVNSDKYTIKHGISALKLKLSLQDVVALGLSCAYVFSLRSGLCDVLVGAREKLYAFYPAMLHREINSLNKCFEPTPNVNEIGIWKWKIDPVLWEGVDLTLALQKYINTLYYGQIKEKIKHSLTFFSRHHCNSYKFRNHLFEDLAGKGTVFAENNLDNIEHKYQSKKISFLGLPLYSREYEACKQNSYKVKHEILGGLLQFKKSYDTQSLRISLFGLQIFSMGKSKKKLLWINYCHPNFAPKWLNKIQSQIGPKYDDIYFLRHNIGETYVELVHLAEVLKVNKSKKPLLVLWDKKYSGFYNMFLPKGMDMQFIDLPHNIIHRIFDKDTMITRDKQRFICSSPQIAYYMKTLVQQCPKVNFYDYINEQVGIKKDTPPALPVISSVAIRKTETKIKYIELQDKFVILCPEANTLMKMNNHFWAELAQGLRHKGYDVFVNAYDKSLVLTDTKTSRMTIEELLILAKRSAGIITLGSGMAVFLTVANVKMDLIYTEFDTKSIGYDPDFVIQTYSVHHLPNVCKDLVKEHNMSKTNETELLNSLLQRY